MDDNTFDKKIKEKVEAFQDTGFDEHALAGLHQRMSGISYQPWYGSYRKATGYAAAVIIISLLNFGLFAYFQHGRHQELLASVEELKQNQAQFDRLKKDFEVLKLSKTDTLYVYSGTTSNNIHNSGISSLQNYASTYAISKSYNTSKYTLQSGKNQADKTSADKRRNDVRLGDVNELSGEIKEFLAQYELAYIHEDGSVYLQYHNIKDADFVERKDHENPWALNTGEIMIAALEEVPQPEHKLNKHKTQRISAKILKDIEKQKMTGVGFQYGPEVDILKLSSNMGSGKPGFAAGLMAEFIFSPSIRLEAGTKYSFTKYAVNSPSNLGSKLAAFPGLKSDLGTLNQIEQTTHALSFPLHVKYYHPIARDRYIFFAFGASPQMHIRQQFEYEYEYQFDTPENDFTVDIEASKHFDDNKLYAGTLDFSLGIEKKLKNKSILQLSAFYNRGINTLGMEESELAMVGLRSALKFRVN